MQNWNNILQFHTGYSPVGSRPPRRSPSPRRDSSMAAHTRHSQAKEVIIKPIFEPFKAQPILTLTFFAGAYRPHTEDELVSHIHIPSPWKAEVLNKQQILHYWMHCYSHVLINDVYYSCFA